MITIFRVFENINVFPKQYTDNIEMGLTLCVKAGPFTNDIKSPLPLTIGETYQLFTVQDISGYYEYRIYDDNRTNRKIFKYNNKEYGDNNGVVLLTTDESLGSYEIRKREERFDL